MRGRGREREGAQGAKPHGDLREEGEREGEGGGHRVLSLTEI